MNYGVIVAAGRSERMGTKADKAFFSLGTKPVLAYSMQAFEQCDHINGVIVVVRRDRLEAARNMAEVFGCAKVKRVVAGGSTRQDSTAKGLAALGDDVSIVAVHDGARPLARPELIAETVRMAKRYGAAAAAVKIADTIKQVERGLSVARTVDRAKLWAVQTPQTFRREILEEAFALVRKKRLKVTDEASAVELLGREVRLVPSSWANIKITTPEDIPIATALLRL